MSGHRSKIGRSAAPAIELLPFHPLASMFGDALPLMEGKDLDELAGDIKRHDLRFPITTFENQIIEGRNRGRACQIAGVKPRYTPYQGEKKDIPAFILSANRFRRHLTPKQKRACIEILLKSQPEATDREIARQVGVSHHTAAGVRRELEANGQIAHNEDRQESSGRKARGRKPGAEQSLGPKADTPTSSSANGTTISPTAMPLEGKAALELITGPTAEAPMNGGALGGGAPKRRSKKKDTPKFVRARFERTLIAIRETCLSTEDMQVPADLTPAEVVQARTDLSAGMKLLDALLEKLPVGQPSNTLIDDVDEPAVPETEVELMDDTLIPAAQAGAGTQSDEETRIYDD